MVRSRGNNIAPLWTKLLCNQFSVQKNYVTSWLAILERLLTRDRMTSFRMNVGLGCLMCSDANESHEHVLPM